MVSIAKERFALGSYQYFRYSLEYFLDVARELEISYVDLWGATPHLSLDILTPAGIERKAAEVRKRGLKVACITPEQVNYPSNLAAEEEEIRTYSIRLFQKAVDAAQILESPCMLATAGCACFNGSLEEGWKRSRDSLFQVASYAADRNITVLLETLTPASSNLLNTPQQQRRMMEEIGLPNIRPVLDLGQVAHMHQDLADFLSYGDRLGRVHLHDYGDAVHMALGDGHLPLEEILESLEKAGYTGLYSFECNDVRYRQDPAASDRQNMDWLRTHGILKENG